MDNSVKNKLRFICRIFIVSFYFFYYFFASKFNFVRFLVFFSNLMLISIQSSIIYSSLRFKFRIFLQISVSFIVIYQVFITYNKMNY